MPKNIAPRAINAAIAAPFKPIAGIGPKPKIINGSSSMFVNEAKIINKLGSRVSPVALMLLIPTIPTTTKGTPTYKTSIYSLINGIMSPGAPNAVNKTSIVNIPIRQNAAVIINESKRLSVANRAARSGLLAPIALATTDEVPAPNPMATLVTIISIGKAKLRAANSRSPTMPIKNASTNPCNIMAKTPKNTGTVILTKCGPTGPVVRRA